MPDKMRTRERIQRRISNMKTERESFIDHYRDLAQFVSPRRGRFYSTDHTRGGKRWGSIINSQATWALRTAMSGLFTGTMSPSRPWHWLKPAGDPGLAEYGPVKNWIHAVLQQQRDIFRRSNLYIMAPVMFKELLLFGTGCMSHENDKTALARFYTETVGSYMFAQDEAYRVNTVVREKQMTAEQIVRRFSNPDKTIGSNISFAVRNAWDNGNYDKYFDTIHFVGPNPYYEEDNPINERKKFMSIYYEPSHHDKTTFLSEGGFNVFPFYCPRWEVTGEDVYATSCPGMEALADVRSLQSQEKVKARATAKLADPPLHGPPSLKNVPINAVPGANITYQAEAQHALRPIYQVDPKVGELVSDIERTENRINRNFFVDLFQAISSMDGVQPRNEKELLLRNQEALLQLGPALQRLHDDFFTHLIDRTFNQQVEAGILPEPPPELEGQDLEVNFISALAMAQQQVATGNIERLASFTGGLIGAGFEEAKDKFDADQAVDLMADLTGTPPEVVRSDDAVAEIRKQRAQQQEEARQAELEAQQAQAAQGNANAQATLASAPQGGG